MERGDEVIAALVCKPARQSASFIEILAGNDQLPAKRLHRRVFLDRVAFGNDEKGSNTGLSCRNRDRLAMVTARSGHEPRRQSPLSAQGIDVHQPTARLERSSWRMVL